MWLANLPSTQFVSAGKVDQFFPIFPRTNYLCEMYCFNSWQNQATFFYG